MVTTLSFMFLCSKLVLFAFVQPLNIEQYNGIRSMASEIHAYAPDARILTTYYCGEHQISLHYIYLSQ